MSLSSDTGLTMPVVPAGMNYGGNCGNDAWGGDNSWWIILLFICLFGWGGNGWGAGNNGGGVTPYATSAATQADLQRGFDNQGVMNKLNGLEQGLCSLGYDQLNQMNGINTNIAQTGFGIQNAIQAGTVSNIQGMNAIQSQLAGCCCDTREAISGVNYNMAMNANATQRAIENGFAQTGYNEATNTCAITTGVSNAARDIVDNANSNTRAILDALNAQAIAAKDAKIAEQGQQIFGLQLAASQSAQNQYLVNQIRPAPVPAFNVPTPYQFGGCAGCIA